MADKYISEAVIRRLPRYYRKLQELNQAGVERISSQELSQEMGLNASQIRRDFNCFGGFGQQGYGYQVKKLLEELTNILNLDKMHRCIIVGAGNIGSALIAYKEFRNKGFLMEGIFDVNPDVIGSNLNGLIVQNLDGLEDFIRQNDINLAILCTPKDSAQHVCDRLQSLGVSAVWNFAPIELDGPDWMKIENVNLSDSLYILAYKAGN